MAYSSRRANANTVLIARQTDAYTENTSSGDFAAISAEFEFQHEQDQEDRQLAAGQYGASIAPAPGRRHGTWTLRGYMEGFKAAYNYTSDAANASGVPSPVIALLANTLGGGGAAAVSSAAEFLRCYHALALTYRNGSVNAGGSTTTTVNIGDKDHYACGALLAFRTDADETSSMLGFAKTIVDDVQDTVTVRSAMGAAPANADDLAPSLTAYLSSAAIVPMTIWRLGDDAALKWSYIGCIPNKLTLEFSAGKTVAWELSGVCLDRKRYATGGGLSAPTAYQKPKSFLGNNGGRLLLGGVAVCGLHSIKLEINWDLVAIECPNAPEGVSEYVRLLAAETPIRLTAIIPVQTSDTVTAGEDQWETAYEAGTSYAIEGTSGILPGQQFGMSLPALQIASPPKMVDFNGLDAREVVFRPASYTGDTAAGAGSTAAMERLVALGWA